MDYNPTPTPTTRTSVTAIISLVAGLAGFSFLPLLGSIVAVITGHIAKGEIKRSNGLVTGGGLATAGLILGYLMIALGLCFLCIFGLTFAGLITLPFAFPTFGN
jgi:dihydroorotate dehydrogenase